MKNLKKRILSLITAAAAAVGSLGAVPDGVLPGFSVVASAEDPISLKQNTLPNLLRFETAAIYRLDEDIEITDNTLQIIDDVTFILNGHNITINQTNGQDAVQVYENKSFVIQGTGNFTANALNTTYGNGIRCYGGASLTIENGPTVTFTSAAGEGIGASNGTGQTLTIDNATVTNTTLDGSGFSNATITNSTISGSTVTGGTITGSTVTGGTIKSSTVQNSTIDGKTVESATYNENGLPAITYIDANGEEQTVGDDEDYTPVTSSMTSWSGTMVASGTVKINSTVYLTGNVNLILCDGASLTVNGTDLNSAIFSNTLNIYGQSGGGGTLAVVPGSGNYDCGIDVTNLTINGGTVISSGYIAIKSNDVIINGGTVTATGSSQGIRADNLTIKSGNVTALGTYCGVWIDNSGAVVLDWTELTDSIKLGTIEKATSITFTKPFVLSGTNTLATADNIAGKTLVPAYKVTFDVNYDGGEDIIKGVPASTGKVTEPADPTREGYTFGGWYTTSDCETEFDFATTTITAETTDTTIYAKWAEITFTKVPAKAATCTATGNKEYYKGSDNKYYTFADDVYTETTLAAVTIDKLGHNYENGKCTRCGEADPDYKEPDNGGNGGGGTGGYTPVIPSYPFGGGNNNNNNTNTNTNTGEPKIEGGSGASGWSNIASEISKTLEGGSVTVDMAGTTTVPKSVLEAVKGKDVDLVLDMGGGITWTINGKDITSVSDSIDLGVKLGTSDIPVDVVNNVTGEHYSTTIHLNHSGKFGFKAVMTVPLRKQDALLYANLYYYDPKAKELEFVSSAKIDKNGNAELDFNHASDYAIVIDDHPLGCRDVTAKTNGNKVKLTWDAIPDAEKYVVYYKKNGKYKKLTTVSNTALTVTGLKNGKEYEFLIRYSVDGKLSEIAESYKISVTAYYKPAPKLTAGKGYIRIIWDKVENATAYRVYKYVNGKLKLLTEIKDLAAIRLTNTKVGKEYTFAVKAYVNGEWTKVYTSDLVSAVAK